MAEETEKDRVALPRIKLPPWVWALIGALGVGGPSGAMAYLRGGEPVDPRTEAAEAKVEKMKADEIAGIKSDVGSLKKGQERQGRLLSRIAEKLRVREPAVVADEP